MFPAFFGEVWTPPMLADLLPVIDDWQPALIVNDAAELAAPLAAQLRGVPYVTHAFGALLPAGRLAETADVLAPLWQAHGLEPRPYVGSYDHPYLDITLTPAEATADAIAHAVGRLLAEPAFGDAARRVREEIDTMPSPHDVAAVLEDLR